METSLRAAWVTLALVHLLPASVLARPQLLGTLYGVEPGGALTVLLVHRGALFLALVMACLFAAFDPLSRRVVSVVLAFSVISFLWVYARSGAPAGALRTVAFVDLVALAPLAWVSWAAWHPSPC